MFVSRIRHSPWREWGGVATSLGILALTFAAYVPAYGYDFGAHAGFVWDDDDHFLNDHLIAADDGWRRIWLDPEPGIVGFPGAAAVWNYWPLTRTSFWLDRQLWGTGEDGRPNLFAAHVVNVALHGLNAILLFVVLRRLRVPGASLAGLLFAVHPVTVESVAWLTERKNLVSGVMFLTALWAWLRFDEEEQARWYLLASLAFLMALMAKSSTVMLPVVLLVLHGYRRREWGPRVVMRLAPFFAMALVSGVTSIVFERWFIGSSHPGVSAGIGERIAGAGQALWFYLSKALVPLELSFNYPRWSIDPAAPLSYAGTVAVICVAALLWRLRDGQARGVGLALCCFAVLLFPVLGFFDVYGMRYARVADHWQYLALMPIVALVGGLVAYVGRAASRALPSVPGARRLVPIAIGTVLVGTCAGLTWRQSRAYVDAETLWAHTLMRQPDSVLANNNLGNGLLRRRHYQRAIPYFERAARSDTSPEPWVNLGIAVKGASGDARHAAPYWLRAIEIDPEQPHALRFLAELRLSQGRRGEAEALLRRALEAHPTFTPALESLARLHAQDGRPSASAPFIARARRPTVDLREQGRRLMGIIWLSMGLALGGCLAVAWAEARLPALDCARPSREE